MTRLTRSLLILCTAWRLSLSSPMPHQFFNFPPEGDPIPPPFGMQPTSSDGVGSGPDSWKPRQLTNATQWPGVDPLLSSSPDDNGSKFLQPRQVQQDLAVDSSPKIFKVDDFIIISNPKPAAALPCIPPSRGFMDDNSIENRLGDGDDSTEPSRCVWSIIACCSPGSRNIRYACFELLGCPGAFWDVNPCDDKVVMAAASVALNFYSQKANSTSAVPPYPPAL